MSHTDKHRPMWVQIGDPENRGFKRQMHDHRNHVECDLDWPIEMPEPGELQLRTYEFLFQWRRTGCYWWPTPKAWAAGIVGRGRGRPRTQREHGLPRDGRARMDLRRLRHKWLSQPREDIDSGEDLPTNMWLWHKWRR
jgi:hypothetical protein